MTIDLDEIRKGVKTVKRVDIDELKKSIEDGRSQICLYSIIIWHHYPDEKPITNGEYLIAYGNGTVECDYFNGDFAYNDWVTAWAEMPEPYGGKV